jgi:uncharacterized protein (TIGR02596 family)
MMLPPRIRLQGRCRAFTLVELITVMAIMAILTAVSIPALSALLDSMGLAGGGQIVASQVSLARQIAASRNCDVEVRLLQSPKSSNGNPFYNAIQLWAVLPPSTISVPANRLVTLPTGAIISSNLSPPLNSPLLAAMGSGTMAEGPSQTVKYVSFRISPEGLCNIIDPTNTDPVTKAPRLAYIYQDYFTVVTLSKAANTTVPLNYVAIQINPATGTPLVYRP